MKTFIAFVVCCTAALSLHAQGVYNTLTINFNGQNRQIIIDGKAFSPVTNPNYDAGATRGTPMYKFLVVTNELAPGTHNLRLVRPNNRRTSESSFTLRNNYDLTINVSGNGSLQQTETLRALGSNSSEKYPMATAAFNTLYAQIRRNRQPTSRYNMIQSAFTNTSHFFTTIQARRLIQLINGEPFRLQLAKSAVRSITDTRNIYTLNSLLASQASKNDLTAFIRTNETNASSGTTGNYRTAMQANAFASLLNNVKNSWQPGARYNLIQTAFATPNNYFTTSQAIQLIQLLSAETERLQMAKDSYKTIVDPSNFTQVYNLLGTQISRDELSYFVRTNGSTPTPANTDRTAMPDASFNSLIEGIRSQWGTGIRKREVMNAFANTNNYFSTYQASQLVQLESNEQDRLDLAKASLRSIVDPQNITLLYNAFTMQSSRDELAAYINTYQGGSGTPVALTPMSEADFADLFNDTRRLWIPGAKRATVLQAFAAPNNYFTTAQAIQLIQLDNDEPDRLVMAKASYKKIVDKQNFTKVYDLFNTQSYKDDLKVYINSIR